MPKSVGACDSVAWWCPKAGTQLPGLSRHCIFRVKPEPFLGETESGKVYQGNRFSPSPDSFLRPATYKARRLQLVRLTQSTDSVSVGRSPLPSPADGEGRFGHDPELMPRPAKNNRQRNTHKTENMEPAPSPLRQPWKAWFVPEKPTTEDYYSWPIQLGGDGHGSLPQPPRIVDFSKKPAKTA